MTITDSSMVFCDEGWDHRPEPTKKLELASAKVDRPIAALLGGREARGPLEPNPEVRTSAWSA